jgi:hypothetical protein
MRLRNKWMLPSAGPEAAIERRTLFFRRPDDVIAIASTRVTTSKAEINDKELLMSTPR